ncbi:hypothetical protein [Imperialibacter roseus]|uniref:Secretion system C-terminal sorting domain-containing protein n=1 Tax=Imperialibacter roseus TaxID=1324217 RepID=A0ABZ0IPT7_9BACT|nr:hypothetical protein [Imperialibacter roseus]WOK07048.1 hypothetical protein RT717_00235 [Imperialibacter roseus]
MDKNLIIKQSNEVGTEAALVRLIGLTGEVFVPTIVNQDRSFVEVDVKDIPLGIYVLEVHGDGLFEQSKIIINR